MMMNKRNISLVLFVAFIVFVISLPIVCNDRYLSRPDSPWQLLPFNADSLSSFYKENYRVIGDTALITFLNDANKTMVVILVDGWGVPYKESVLVHEFSFFADASPIFAIHRRNANITKIAEQDELQWGDSSGVFLYNGDATECDNKKDNLKHYYSEKKCCETCTDLTTLDVLDSLLIDGKENKIAWTTRQTSEGDRTILQQLFQKLSKIVKSHPEVQFIIQGTHRPTLGMPEVRRKYLAPWVPAVFVNCTIKD